MRKNVSLYKYKNSYKLTTTEAANFIRFKKLYQINFAIAFLYRKRSELAYAIRNAP